MTNEKIKDPSTKSFKKRMIWIMLIILSILLVCIVISVGVLMAWSPGKPKPFLDEKGKPIAGSISEKVHVNINGVDQGMFIKGKDKTKPVLLFVHGGPGMPEYAISQKYTTVLENYFTVCWWEQRGSGMSYKKDIDKNTMTVDQFISDTIEVTNYLRKRFGQEKIYLMGHSWGTFIGIQVAAKAPELYYAYLGMSQISRQLESEKQAYEYMIDEFKKIEDNKMLKKLEEYDINNKDVFLHSYTSSLVRDDAMHSLGIGTTHNMKSLFTGIFMPVMKNPEYTLMEKINIWRGKAFSQSCNNLGSEIYEVDLSKEIKKLDIPVYFFGGVYDYTVSYNEAKAYFEKLVAPMKGFYRFNQSAHSPMFEEPEKFISILKEDVLARSNNLADLK